jgi:hypothetical protein
LARNSIADHWVVRLLVPPVFIILIILWRGERSPLNLAVGFVAAFIVSGVLLLVTIYYRRRRPSQG